MTVKQTLSQKHPEITSFLFALLTASNLKIYDPIKDCKLNIFQLPPTHQELLKSYILQRLADCSAIKSDPFVCVKQQDKRVVVRVDK